MRSLGNYCAISATTVSPEITGRSFESEGEDRDSAVDVLINLNSEGLHSVCLCM